MLLTSFLGKEKEKELKWMLVSSCTAHRAAVKFKSVNNAWSASVHSLLHNEDSTQWSPCPSSLKFRVSPLFSWESTQAQERLTWTEGFKPQVKLTYVTGPLKTVWLVRFSHLLVSGNARANATLHCWRKECRYWLVGSWPRVPPFSVPRPVTQSPWTAGDSSTVSIRGPWVLQGCEGWWEEEAPDYREVFKHPLLSLFQPTEDNATPGVTCHDGC